MVKKLSRSMSVDGTSSPEPTFSSIRSPSKDSAESCCHISTITTHLFAMMKTWTNSVSPSCRALARSTNALMTLRTSCTRRCAGNPSRVIQSTRDTKVWATAAGNSSIGPSLIRPPNLVRKRRT